MSEKGALAKKRLGNTGLHVSIGRAYTPRSLCYCLFAPLYMGVVLCAHSVRGEPRIQRNASGEVATQP